MNMRYHSYQLIPSILLQTNKKTDYNPSYNAIIMALLFLQLLQTPTTVIVLPILTLDCYCATQLPPIIVMVLPIFTLNSHCAIQLTPDHHHKCHGNTAHIYPQ